MNTTHTIEQSVQVHFRYAVHFTVDLFAPENPLLKDVISRDSANLPKKALFVIDQGVFEHHRELPSAIEAYCRQHRDTIALVCPPMIVIGGEQAKNDPGHVRMLHEAINAVGLCRHSFVVAIGSGAVLDMAGYAAATAHRGVRLIRVPTSVLAQNDSGVGVKNGINAFGKKNFLGTFAPPYAVLNDFTFLASLPAREWRGGIAEAIKVALIKDAGFFEFLDQHSDALIGRDMGAMRHLVYRCAELHLQHIATSGDPFELGSSRPLDFGHWAAHKLEQLTDYRLRHGEAVAIGIALDCTYSYLAGLLPRPAWKRVINVLLAFGFTLYVPELSRYLKQRDDPRCILQGLNEFREHLGGQLTIMLLKRIGQGVEVHEIDEALVKESIALIEDIAASYPAQPADEDDADRSFSNEERRTVNGSAIQHMPLNETAVNR